MNNIQIANLFGFIAAAIGIVMFIPQAITIYKTKNTKSISLLSFSLLSAASVCWIVYGIILNAAPILLVNTVVLIVSSYIAVMKFKHG